MGPIRTALRSRFPPFSVPGVKGGRLSQNGERSAPSRRIGVGEEPGWGGGPLKSRHLELCGGSLRLVEPEAHSCSSSKMGRQTHDGRRRSTLPSPVARLRRRVVVGVRSLGRCWGRSFVLWFLYAAKSRRQKAHGFGSRIYESWMNSEQSSDPDSATPILLTSGTGHLWRVLAESVPPRLLSPP
jgi:hypothetical protein